MPKPQNRLGPTGIDLSSDFVLSDRYFVPTWKYLTSLGKMPEAHSAKRQTYFSVFMHEYQSLLRPLDPVTAMEGTVEALSKKRSTETLPPVRSEKRPLQTMLIGAFAAVYDQKSQLLPTYNKLQRSQSDFKTQTLADSKPGGCGCSRNS